MIDSKINKGHIIQSIESSIKAHEKEIVRLQKIKTWINLLDHQGKFNIVSDSDEIINNDLEVIRDVISTKGFNSYDDFKGWLLDPRRGNKFLVQWMENYTSKKYSFRDLDYMIKKIFEVEC